MKCKSLKLSDYVTIRQNKYSIIQLIPIKSNRNTSTDQVAAMINKLYKSTSKLISKENKKIIINQQMKVSFYIHITKDKVQFFFIIPSIHLNKFKVKFKEIWRHIEIKEIDHLPVDLNACSKYEVVYESDDVLSISTDKRNNDLLNANLSIVTNLQDHEEVGIFYNFIPTGEKESNYFSTKSKEKVQKYNRGYSFKKNKTLIDIITIIAKTGIIFLNDLIDSLLNMDSHNNDVFINATKEATPSTKRKLKSDICKSQILLVSTAKTPTREEELVKTLGNTFKVIDDDNKLIINKVTKVIDIKKPLIRNVKVNKTSVQECSNFINMPSVDIIKDFGMIEHNKTYESEVPKELQKGIVSLGINKCKEHQQEAFLSDDINLQSLPLSILGASRSGKSTYSINMAKDFINNGEGFIAIDFIKNTELADAIAEITPSGRLIDIDLSNPSMIQSLCYNEFKITSNMSAYEISSISRKQTNNVLKLVNVINGDDKELSPKMRKYLGAAARIGFCFSNTCMRDILDILQYHDIRHSFINRLNEELKSKLRDSILSLKELDEKDKTGEIVGTKDSKIEGIMDRIDLMRENIIIDEMLSKTPENNIDFVKAMEDHKVILIRMRDKEFDDDVSIDVLTSFYLQKIWAATKIRGTMHKLPDRVTVLVDEIFQTPCAQKILAKNFVQSAKFGLKYVLTLHYLQQLLPDTLKAMANSNSSYMLISGVEEQAFKALQSDFEKEGYTVDDLLNLDRYNSLNLIKTKNGKSAFITKLPQPS